MWIHIRYYLEQGGWGELLTSDSSGKYLVESPIVNITGSYGLPDVERVFGLNGVILATTVTQTVESQSTMTYVGLKTRITFNDGISFRIFIALSLSDDSQVGNGLL